MAEPAEATLVHKPTRWRSIHVLPRSEQTRIQLRVHSCVPASMGKRNGRTYFCGVSGMSKMVNGG